MAAAIKFDVVRRARVTNSKDQGLTIVRQCMVYNIPITAGTSDPSMLMKCIAVSGFPQIDEIHPGTVEAAMGAKVVQQDLRGIDRTTNAVDCDITYRAPALASGGGGGIFFTLTQQPQTSTIPWYSTADLSQILQVSYTPTGGSADIRAVRAHKVAVSQVLRASAVVTRSEWESVAASVIATKGAINSSTWGGYGRGSWLCLGPDIRNLDSAGSSFFMQFVFLESPQGQWFATEVARDSTGNIPKDIDNEASISLPAENAQVSGNGITVASIYPEADFGSVFGFSPYA